MLVIQFLTIQLLSVALAKCSSVQNEPDLTLDFDVRVVDKPPKKQQQHQLPSPPRPDSTQQLTRNTRQAVSGDWNSGLVRSAEVQRRCEQAGYNCTNGGHCDAYIHNDPSTLACMCPIGFTGERCEIEGNFRYPEFNGNGYLIFPLDHFELNSLTLSLDLLPKLQNGIVLYASGVGTFTDQFLALVLKERRLQFRYNNGDGLSIVTASKDLDINVWHTVTIHRSSRVAWIQINETSRRSVSVPAASSGAGFEAFRDQGSRFYLDSKLYVAGLPRALFSGQISAQTESDAGYIGCVGNVTLNRRVCDPRRKEFHGHALFGMNIYDCALTTCNMHRCENSGKCRPTKPPSEYMCLCSNATGRYCENPLNAPITVPHFDGTAYLKLRGGLKRTSKSRTDLTIVFRPESLNGLLLYAGYSKDTRGDFLAAGLVDGRVFAAFDLGSGPVVIRSRHPVPMHRWCLMNLRRVGRQGTLRVSGQSDPIQDYSPGELVQLTIKLDTFVGGHKNYDDVSAYLPVRDNFKGCIQSISLGQLGQVEFPQDVKLAMNLQQCRNHTCSNERDACGPGGVCVPDEGVALSPGRGSGIGYSCVCHLGFNGERCERHRDKRQISAPRFRGHGYLMFRSPTLMNSLSVSNFSLSMRVHLSPEQPSPAAGSAASTLLLIGGPRLGPIGDHYLHLTIDRVDRKLSVAFGDGQTEQLRGQLYQFDAGWHTVVVSKLASSYIVYVDGLPRATIVEQDDATSDEEQFAQLLIGGLNSDTQLMQGGFAGQQTGVDACIVDIVFTVKGSDSSAVTQLTVDTADDGRDVDQCSAETAV